MRSHDTSWKIGILMGSFGDTFDDQAEALKLAARIAGGEKNVRERFGSPSRARCDGWGVATRSLLRYKRYGRARYANRLILCAWSP